MHSHSMPMHRRRLLWAGALAAMPALGQASAQRPIRLVVPFPAGGGTDVMGRLLAQELGRELGTPLVVDNVSGATGTLGSAQVARAAPDGLTLLVGVSATHAIAPALYKDLRYRPERDFVAIARVAHGGNVLVAHPDLAADTAADLVTLARRSREPLLYASWGVGSGGHLAAEAIRQSTGIALEHVPYQGVAPLLQDLAGGQIRLAMADVAGALPLLRAGRIKALAIAGRRRSSALPQVAMLSEGGVAFDTDIWYALFAPAQLPAAHVQRLASACGRALRQPHAADRISALGMESEPISREDFVRQWHDDIATWSRLVQAAGLQAA